MMIFREMFEPGANFLAFLTKEQAVEAFRLKNTEFLGGFVSVNNPVITGYYKDLPVMEITCALVPLQQKDLSVLHHNTFVEEVVASKKVCQMTEIFVNSLLSFVCCVLLKEDCCS